MTCDATRTRAEAGAAQIEWVRRFMPLSAAAAAGLELEKGSHIGMALPLDPATASLAMWLMNAGFALSVLSQETADDKADLLAALGEAGANICDGDKAFRQCGCDIVLSEDSDVLPQGISGAVLTSATQAVEPAVPIITLGASPLLQAAITHGVGQACVSGFLDITNLQIAGSCVLVIGYDGVGQGVAKCARSYGARVIVSEQDPVKAVHAKLDGHDAANLDDALPEAAVVFHASKDGPRLTLPQIRALPNGAFLCCGVKYPEAFAQEKLQVSAPGKVIRDHVTQHGFEGGTNIKLVCDGKAIHTHAGKGLPLEYADLRAAACLYALAELTSSNGDLELGVHTLPFHIENRLAQAFLDQG